MNHYIGIQILSLLSHEKSGRPDDQLANGLQQKVPVLKLFPIVATLPKFRHFQFKKFPPSPMTPTPLSLSIKVLQSADRIKVRKAFLPSSIGKVS
jgi:hypothetical protein